MRVRALPAAAAAATLGALALAGGATGAAREAAASGAFSAHTLFSGQSTAMRSAGDFYAVGGGWANAHTEHFELSAHQRESGDFGQFSSRVYDASGDLVVSYRVDVDCVHIHPVNRAVIKGNVRKVTPVPNTLGVERGERVILGVEDGGNPSDPVPSDDWFTPHSDTFPGDCHGIVYVGNANNVLQGNINVKGG